MLEAWNAAFRSAEGDAAEAIEKLDVVLGFKGKLKAEHVLGYCSAGPRVLMVEAIRQALSGRRVSFAPTKASEGVEVVSNVEAFAAWGFKDSRFVLNGRTVKFESPHYELGGRELNKLIPFLEKEMATKIDLSLKVSREIVFTMY